MRIVTFNYLPTSQLALFKINNELPLHIVFYSMHNDIASVTVQSSKYGCVYWSRIMFTIELNPGHITKT